MSIISQESCKLSSYTHLEGLSKKKCSKCGKNRMYFCYDCRVTLPGVFSPQVKNSKSSAIHCKIVAPEQTRVFDVPDVFDYGNEEVTNGEGSSVRFTYNLCFEFPCGMEFSDKVLVFPSPSAVSIEEFVRKKGPIKRLVVLDCTWFQVNMMQKIPQIQGLPCVSLTKYRTAFWRPQHNVDESGLATIEAIYYALKEYQEYGLKRPYQVELFWVNLTICSTGFSFRDNLWTRSKKNIAKGNELMKRKKLKGASYAVAQELR
ncbi:unnamed protein product [Strongylus vulgaris]|uniref:tRNA-uridine aminocarboxypropyltransferase 1 n=1 Tax=Strongylus vulgaris TaxID=40348 RepID=A0A3P7JWK4_STRVU|nr:unnamed protein product [Strongylus vulgaris]